MDIDDHCGNPISMGGKIKKKKNIKTTSLKRQARQHLSRNQFLHALEFFLRVTKIDSRDAEAHQMAGALYGMQGKHHEAAGFLQRAAALQPKNAAILYNLGIALRETGEMEKAAKAFHKAIELKPDYSEALNALSHVLIGMKQLDHAVETMKKVVTLNPGSAEPRQNLASTLQAQGRIEEAIEQYKAALEIQPNMSIAWDGLGSALVASGQYTEALRAAKKSLQTNPGNARGHSNLLLTLNYMEDLPREEVFQEHRTWWEQHKPAKVSTPVVKDPDPDRPLRIGYVSPDFREHSVAYFIEPLLEAHHWDLYNTWCYSSVPRPDETTRKLQALSGHWRDISRMKPEQTAEQIRKDGIDILVDLAGHTAGNHLTLFMRKPAPIQVTWLGYPNTTGMEVMDYRIVDEITDPPGSEAYCTEKLIRIPGCFLCYKPLQDAPEINPPPCNANGYITFGSFNNRAKISRKVIEAWSRILKTLPDARLLLKTSALTDLQTRERLKQDFLAKGILPEQLELMGHTPTRQAHLALYRRIDVALDTFPYNGTTTTCEALWMGVPVVALLGDRHASRVSASLLNNADLGELVAGTPEEYVEIACRLAGERGTLKRLRSEMRNRLLASTLCDGSGFAKQMEVAFRNMWCEKSSSADSQRSKES